ncbi:MAG: Lrp/AsnC family transcriptional regulator [Nanoarchaeota archaeon]
MTLDLLDRRLLYELDLNARQPLSVLTKKIHVSRNVLIYRLNRLRESGIIKNSFAEINSIALGYKTFRIFIKIGNCSPDERKRLDAFLMSQRNLTWFSRVLGEWDIDVLFTSKDIEEFETFRNSLFLSFNSMIKDSHISLLSRIYCYHRDYLLGKERKEVIRKVLGPSKCVPDSKDEEILYLLTEDGAMSALEISRRTSLSVNTVIKRIHTLENENVILAYRVFIDTNKLGYQYFKLHIFLRDYSQKDIIALRHFLESKSYVVYTDHYIGGADFEIELHLKTEMEYTDFVDSLIERFGRIIEDHRLIKFYEELLFRYLPLRVE